MFQETVLHNSNIDICCLSELWLKTYHDNAMISMQGYNLFRLDRNRVSAHGSFVHGGGLLVYVNERFQSQKVDFLVNSKHAEIMLCLFTAPLWVTRM